MSLHRTYINLFIRHPPPSPHPPHTNTPNRTHNKHHQQPQQACAEAGQGAKALDILAKMRGTQHQQQQGVAGVTLDYLGYLKVVELLGASGLVDEALAEIGHLRRQQEEQEQVRACAPACMLLHRYTPPGPNPPKSLPTTHRPTH